MVEWPFKGLNDIQLGDKKVTLNHLVYMMDTIVVALKYRFEALEPIGFMHVDSNNQSHTIVLSRYSEITSNQQLRQSFSCFKYARCSKRGCMIRFLATATKKVSASSCGVHYFTIQVEVSRDHPILQQFSKHDLWKAGYHTTHQVHDMDLLPFVSKTAPRHPTTVRAMRF